MEGKPTLATGSVHSQAFFQDPFSIKTIIMVISIDIELGTACIRKVVEEDKKQSQFKDRALSDTYVNLKNTTFNSYLGKTLTAAT